MEGSARFRLLMTIASVGPHVEIEPAPVPVFRPSLRRQAYPGRSPGLKESSPTEPPRCDSE